MKAVLAAARANLERFLEELPEYVVLRNHDDWLNSAPEVDVDLLVEDIDGAEEALFHYLGVPMWTSKRSHVWGYRYPWGKIDLLPHLEWRGAVYLPNQAVFQASERSDDGLPRPHLVHEALVSWLSSLLWGGFFRECHEAVILEAARQDGAALKRALVHAAGRVWGERLWWSAVEGRPADSANWTKQVGRAVRWQALRHDTWNTVLRWLRFWRAEVRLRLRPPVPWVVFLGPDGSGKSSIVAALKLRLAAGFSGVSTHHWRPRFLLSSRGGGYPATDPHGTPPRGTLASSLKLAFLLLDWTLGYWGYLIHLRAKGYLVLFDRNYHDLLVDMRRYRYGGPRWMARLVGRLVPRADLLILLDAPPEIFQARKQEVPLEETSRQREAYLGLTNAFDERCVLDASKPLADVLDDAERAIGEYLSRRTVCGLRPLKGKT